jgi:hypothetical protein
VSEQIADLDKRHFLAWRPRRLCLLVLRKRALTMRNSTHATTTKLIATVRKLPQASTAPCFLGLGQGGRRRADRTLPEIKEIVVRGRAKNILEAAPM